MGEVVRDAVIRLKLEQQAAKIKAPDLGPILEARRRELQLINDSLGASVRATASQVAGFSRTTEMIEDQIAVLQREEQATIALSDGFILAARSAAVLGVLGRKETLKLLKSVIAVQAAFDLFKGTTGIILTMVEADKKLSVAKEGLELATTKLMAAEKKMAASRAGVVLVTIGAVEADKKLSDAKKSLKLATAGLEASEKKMAAATTSLAAITKILKAELTAEAIAAQLAMMATTAFWISLGLIAVAMAAIVAIGASIVSIYRSLTKESREAAEAEERRLDVMERLRASTLKQTKIETTAIARRQQMRREIAGLYGKEKQLADLRKSNAGARGKLGAIDANIQQATLADDDTQKTANIEKLKAARAVIVSDLERQRELEKSSVSMGKQKLAELAEEINKRNQSVELAKRALDTEKERVTGIKAQIGAMSDLQKAELTRLAEKLKAGEKFTNAELQTLSTGGADAQAIARKEFSKRSEGIGDKFAKEATRRGLGPEVTLQERQATLSEAKTKLGESTGGKSADDALEAIKTKSDKMTTAWETFVDNNTEIIEAGIRGQDQLSTEIDEIKKGLQSGAM